MKILFLTEQFPYPLHDGGNLRTFHLLAGLAQAHEITLISHAPSPGVLSQFPISCRIVTVEKPKPSTRIATFIRQRWRHHRSLFLAKNWSSPLLDAAQREIDSAHFDAMHFNHLDTACYALSQDWKPLLKVFDTHNCLSAMAQQVSQNAPAWWRRRLFSLEARNLREAESAVCELMDKSLVCSNIDAQKFRELCPNVRSQVIPNGVDTEYFCPNPLVSEEDNSIVFTGAMNYFPNEQGAQYFCNCVLPLMKTLDVKLYLVGRRPSSLVSSLHDGERTVVTGEVGDVRPFIDRSQVFVAPLRHGSGTRLKILEAFAMGMAVVSTSIGAEGIPVTDGQELILANSPEEFASSVDELLGDDARRSALGNAAREFVHRNFDWKTIQAGIRKTYLQLENSNRAA